MGRKVTGINTESEAPTDFANVVDGICRGGYVLLLGSEIIMNRDEYQECDGDSLRFLLENIIQTQNSRGRNYPMASSMTEFILDNNLNARDVKEWMLTEIDKNITFDLTDINPYLRRLLESKCFRVVITTTLDPYVEKLMESVWGKDNFRVMNIYNQSATNFDLGRTDLRGDEYYDMVPTLYYAFGKADPQKRDMRFVLTDNDLIDCVSRWLSDTMGPQNMLSYIEQRKLLGLGCNLKDWCFRFFWYAMRHKDSNRLGNGDIAVMLKPEISEQDKNLYDYLRRTVGIRLQTDSRKYLANLADALDEKVRAEDALTASRKGGVFISYASEDFTAAWNLFTKIRNAGMNVWLDNVKLSVGDAYDRRIADAISQCRVFIPILSRTVAEDITNGRNRYYRKEWELAAGENSDIKIMPVVLPGYDPRGAYHALTGERISAVTVFDWAKEPFDSLKNQIIKSLDLKSDL